MGRWTKNYQSSLAFKMFGKRTQELTEDETKELNKRRSYDNYMKHKEKYNEKRRIGRPESLCEKLYGKKTRELTREERNEYNRILVLQRTIEARKNL